MGVVEKDINCPLSPEIDGKFIPCGGKGKFTRNSKLKFTRTKGPQTSAVKFYECRSCGHEYWKFSKTPTVKIVSRETNVGS